VFGKQKHNLCNEFHEHLHCAQAHVLPRIRKKLVEIRVNTCTALSYTCPATSTGDSTGAQAQVFVADKSLVHDTENGEQAESKRKDRQDHARK
jgi:hypothetical protein